VSAAAEVSAPTLRDKHDPAVWQKAGIEVVGRAVGQLHKAAAVGIHLEDVVADIGPPLISLLALVLLISLDLRVGEEDCLAVVRQLRREECAGGKVIALEPSPLDD